MVCKMRLGSDQVHYGDIEEFRDCLEACGLSDLPATGFSYTWSNRQGGHLKWAKLEMILGHSNWLNTIYSTACFLPAGVSDHSPVWVQVQNGVHNKRNAFKYLESWSKSKKFYPCVQKYWDSHFHGVKISILLQKFKQVKNGLKEVHRKEFSGISDRVKAVKDELLSCQAQLGGDYMNSMLADKVNALTQSYVALRKVEMSILKQRAKVMHTNLSDTNTRYFYAKIAERKARNSIGVIKDAEGEHLYWAAGDC
ncbi:uncharacterized protein LOC141655589 [Silene latifolia]|uniref:uncharacterized protein LOC141655589 n=1 Tax=Silene latifolia TaxID=37657 RepID=UPI003D7852D0